MTEKFKKLQKLYATVTQMSGGAFDYAATRSSNFEEYERPFFIAVSMRC
jgi:hypothetical protein